MSDAAQADRRLWLPVTEVARMTGFSRSTVTRAMDDGEFPFVQFRSSRRVPAGFVKLLISLAHSGSTLVIEEAAAAWRAQATEVSA